MILFKRFFRVFGPFIPAMAVVVAFTAVFYMMGFIGRTPKMGEVYTYGGNPFQEHRIVMVLDVKNRWVLYIDQLNITNSSKLSVFRSLYNKRLK